MTLIALTGGIAAGKSTIADRFTELGATHIDADVLAREVVAPGTPGLRAIAAEFGPDVLLPSGELNRAALAEIVFSDAARRDRLNQIVHPAVRDLAARYIEQAQASNQGTVVVYDVPLLVEGNVQGDWDLVVVAEAPQEKRLERLVQLRGMDRVEAQARIAAQASDSERRAVADVVIDTGGSMADTLEQVDAVWRRLRPTGPTRPA